MKTRCVLSTDSINGMDGALSLAESGFTLIELLIVVVILATLASLLLPALGRARARGQGVKCLQNLRQMGIAWMLYADDNFEVLPPNMNALNRDETKTWVRGWLNTANTPDNTNIIYLQTSSLAPYLGNALDVWKCPSDKSTSLHGGVRYPRVRSISMNGYFNNENYPWAKSANKMMLKYSDITEPGPSGTWAFIDERADSINNGNFCTQSSRFNPINPADMWLINYPANYHAGAGNLSFADGHGESHRWVDPRTTPPPNTLNNHILNGIYNPKNQDLYWLLPRTAGRSGFPGEERVPDPWDLDVGDNLGQ